MNRRTAVALSLAALGTNAALALAAVSAAGADEAPPARAIDQDIDLSGARRLTIRTTSASLRVRSTLARRQAHPGESGPPGASQAGGTAASGASAHVHADLHGLRTQDAPTVRVSREGAGVVVTIEGAKRRGWFGSWSSWDSYTFEVALAADVELALSTASGNVLVDAPPGALGVRTGSGNVTVIEPRGAVDAGTGSGNVSVRGAASSLTLDTGSGNVAAALNAGWSGEAVRVETGSGNVRLTVPAGFHADVKTHTGSGRVVDEAHVAAASAPLVSLRTGSGNVRIVPAAS